MKNNRWFTKFRWLPLIALFGCAGVQKSCAAGCASSFGADWIVVQYNNNGDVMKHWCLKNTSVDNEGHSDGIWWQDTQGHLVHLSGWYNRVQVSNGEFGSAAQSLGLPVDICEKKQ